MHTALHNNTYMTFLVMWCQCWHYMTLMASSIVPWQLLVQNQMIVACLLESFDTVGIGISILCCQWPKQGVT